VSKRLILGLVLIVFATTNISRFVYEAVGIGGYGGFGINVIVFWAGVLIATVSAIRLALRRQAAKLEK